jgi:hypothetical protein
LQGEPKAAAIPPLTGDAFYVVVIEMEVSRQFVGRQRVGITDILVRSRTWLFASENRAYVEKVARGLKSRQIRVFYDLYEEANLWGKNLYEHLTEVYQDQASFTVMFISKEYAAKLWTNHERRSAQSRAFETKQEYFLPVRFDDTKVSRVLRTVGYIDLRTKTPADLCELIIAKLRGVRNTTSAKVNKQSNVEVPRSPVKKGPDDSAGFRSQGELMKQVHILTLVQDSIFCELNG